MEIDKTEIKPAGLGAFAFLSLGFSLVMFVGVLFLFVQGMGNIEQYRIHGQFRHLNNDAIAARIKSLPVKNYFLVDVNAVADAIKRLPWVSSVYVRRAWPDRLDIYVREHQPLARWGGEQLLSSDGRLFSPEKTSLAELPMVKADTKHVKNVAENLHLFSQELKSLGLKINSLRVDQRGAWSLTLSNGMTVMLGRRHFAKRMERFIFAYPRFDGVEKISRVDLRYKNGVAVQWHKSGKSG